jgi:lipoprotein-anchoring transpeptidase ErfK/SrfK
MRFFRHAVAVALAAIALGAGGGAFAADPVDPTLPGPPSAQDGSWTARILYPVAARSKPGGRVVAKLLHYTAFSQGPAVYMVTERQVVNRKTWIRILLPKRPNGTRAWVPADAVDLHKISTWIRVSNGKRTVQVLSKGKVVKTFRAAVGTGGTPTPRGLFAILDPVPTNGELGPYILVLTAHSNVLKTFGGGDGIVAIHGWPSSDVLGKAVSHGCVRMARGDVRILARYARAGVPVQIGA